MFLLMTSCLARTSRKEQGKRDTVDKNYSSKLFARMLLSKSKYSNLTSSPSIAKTTEKSLFEILPPKLNAKNSKNSQQRFFNKEMNEKSKKIRDQTLIPNGEEKEQKITLVMKTVSGGKHSFGDSGHSFGDSGHSVFEHDVDEHASVEVNPIKKVPQKTIFILDKGM